MRTDAMQRKINRYKYYSKIKNREGKTDMNEKSLLFSAIVTIGTMHTFEVALKENGYTIKSKVVNPENFNVLFILEADRPDYEFLEFKENLKDIVEFV